jgi:hypothetical protein
MGHSSTDVEQEASPPRPPVASLPWLRLRVLALWGPAKLSASVTGPHAYFSGHPTICLLAPRVCL